MKKIAEGLSCSSKEEVEGILKFVKSVNDVIELFDDAKGKICLVEDSGTTTLGPILSDLSGVLCTTGTEGSHLAIVSREFEIPCIMSINLKKEEIAELDGKKVKIVTEGDKKGILYLVE
ncbi:MAG: PEP-utilizing enzyme [Candidatus Helarchaeota archaeon]